MRGINKTKCLYTLQVFPKTPKLSPGPASLARQDTIDEGGEVDPSPPRDRPPLHVEREQRSSLERQPTERDRLLDPALMAQKERERLERNLSLERERQIEMACSRATTSDTYDTGLREQPPTLAQRDLIATVLDMKVDVRLEMQRMSQRIGKIEDLLAELVKRLSADATTSGASSPASGMPEDAGPIPVIPTTISMGTITTSVVPPPSTSSGAMVTVANPATSQGTGSGGNGLGPILLRKRRSKSRKAPAPPKQSPEQARLLDPEPPTAPPATTRKREFL